MTDQPTKTLRHMVENMRADPEVLERFAVDLAITAPGDWETLAARVASRGYQTNPEELRAALKPDAPDADDFLKSWA
ncbi:hypothetical protein [Leptothoe sp. PORK10 BA2]|uniref:hypothetical protein n=1 Tax=Leptothoe sp. PORK10 BA2 TaxID=3110254 RepID=UPI002B21A60E|nr:hypothetical protein [Leptothoe sp. PORK10 BA2]MEA5464220.1 hypothetical protein [Leptothoe sp. PORK10 BA2]